MTKTRQTKITPKRKVTANKPPVDVSTLPISKDIKKSRACAIKKTVQNVKEIPLETKKRPRSPKSSNIKQSNKESDLKEGVVPPKPRESSLKTKPRESSKIRPQNTNLTVVIPKKCMIERISNLVSQQSAIKDNVSIGSNSQSYRPSVFEQLSKLEKNKKISRAPFHHNPSQIKTTGMLMQVASLNIDRQDQSPTDTSPQAKKILQQQPTYSSTQSVAFVQTKIPAHYPSVSEQKTGEGLLWPELKTDCLSQNLPKTSEPPQIAPTNIADKTNSNSEKSQMTADFRNEQRSSIRPKLNQFGPAQQNQETASAKINTTNEAGTQYENIQGTNIQSHEAIDEAIDNYEKIKSISEGGIQKRLFLCAQIFFNPNISESEIFQVLKQ